MKLVNKFFIKFFGLQVVKHNFYENLIQKADSNVFFLEEIINYFGTENDLFNLMKESKSQILQDVFCLFATNFKENGYFVEFGATDGKNLSNTYLLEKKFNWNGILAEPCKKFHSDLNNNRNCIIDYRCVYTESNQNILFKESTIGELSTIISYSDTDHHKNNRESGIEYSVKTIS
ncbi:MAG TPA: hypothetical protein PKD85_20110, partial [Saprospiraceae bacterium]|nr:hypothetical protein [Saprospiraceae bacterium]